jgi:hypothetical protein
MKIVDTFSEIEKFVDDCGGSFSLQRWKVYADGVSPELYNKCLADIAEYDFSAEVLPVLAGAAEIRTRLKEAHNSFLAATSNLREKVRSVLNVDVDATIMLYFGLCNGAGWATELDSKPAVLLGIEKIVELNWCDIDSFKSLIFHEIGHIWHFSVQKQRLSAKTDGEKSLLQLYEEGIATYIQRLLMGKDYFHQDTNGWLSWCNANKAALFEEFLRRVEINVSTQDFFGDWCSYLGHSDVGYFLGFEMLRHLSNKMTLKQLANLSIKDGYHFLKHISSY